MEEKVGKFFRLYPGNEVRLKGAYVVKCTGCVKDEAGRVTEILCTYDPDSRGGDPADGRKVKSTIHWVDADNCCRRRGPPVQTISSTTPIPMPPERTFWPA